MATQLSTSRPRLRHWAWASPADAAAAPAAAPTAAPAAPWRHLGSPLLAEEGTPLQEEGRRLREGRPQAGVVAGSLPEKGILQAAEAGRLLGEGTLVGNALAAAGAKH
eukprot:CAMPEP_0117660804 /NCGR_PEP_ID=MMETSP0804-20121206/7161_1 /TAXON_ID=1074897 /ORGANISM="Tetraselmis astigmatica, Strain CCMP880" /LENGTH=107 /DNA_ID=CAMNT_0005467553 /DNA_START=916 /DNA_END=1240 /DNA_ORIENTATION=-